jgi:hypothetical protein
MNICSRIFISFFFISLAFIRNSDCAFFNRSPLISFHLSLFRGQAHGSQQNISPSAEHKNDSTATRRLSSYFVPSARADSSPASPSLVATDEMDKAVSDAFLLMNMTQADVKGQGWNLVHGTDIFSLYKRRERRGSGPAIYLMMGKFHDVSPRTFLYSQINQAQRKIWDTTMRAMKPLSKTSLDVSLDNSEDLLYFKTGWPWPLKDRDYVLARRCKVYTDKKAIVFVSKSTEVSLTRYTM